MCEDGSEFVRRAVVQALRARAPKLWHSLAYWRYLRTGEPEIHRIAEFVDPHRAAVDVGVHVGFYARRLNRYAKGVFGFEANPEHVALLRRTMPRSVKVMEVALSDASGVAVLRVPQDERGVERPGLGTIAPNNDLAGRHYREVAIPSARLDEFDLPPVGFMKIDVEGHEEAVLRGAEAILRRDRPALMVEIEERHSPGSTQRVPSYLSNLGYEAEVFDGRELIPFAAFRPERDQVVGTRYLNNFLFRVP